jgi:hypothetical protein
MIGPRSKHQRLAALLGHVLSSTGPEHETAVAAFHRYCEQHGVAYGDLAFTDNEQQRHAEEMFEEALRRAEGEAQKLKKDNEKLRKEARAAKAQAAQSPELKPPDEAAAFVKAALSVDAAKLSIRDRNQIGRRLAKDSSYAGTHRCLSHDLPFGALVQAELEHHKAMKKEAKAQRKNVPMPTAEEHLVAVFGCSKQWAYRCRDAWRIVTGDSWVSIFAYFYGNRLPSQDEDGTVREGWRDPDFALTITVDVIVRWDREYAKLPGSDEPVPRPPSAKQILATMKQKYGMLRDACLKSSDMALRAMAERLNAEPQE